MSEILGDIRLAGRMFARNPATTALAALALVLGIGLTTTMFSILDGAVLRGLPFEDSSRILHLARLKPAEFGEDDIEVTIHDYLDWREQQTSFEDLSAFYMGTVNLSGAEDRPERYRGAWVTPNTFGQLRVRPILGRDFREEDGRPGAAPVALISYALWQGRFEGSPSVLGRAVRINGALMAIAGVMPAGFAFPVLQDVWVCLALDPHAVPRGEGQTVEVIGRLSPGVSPEEASAEMATIARRLELAYPETNEGITTEVKPYIREFIGDETIGFLATMMLAVLGVLLIACANVANIMLALTAGRTKEIAVRSALGAGRLRIVTQLLVEVSFLALLGGVGGLALAQAGVSLFNRAIVDTEPPFWIDIRIDARVALFVLGAATISALAAGLLPALRASAEKAVDVLRDESRGSTSLRMGRFSTALVVGEIALSFGLLVGAGVMIKSIVNLGRVDPGFATEDVLSASLRLVEGDYPDEASLRRFTDQLQVNLAEQTGASAVALGSSLPLGGGRSSFAIEGHAYDSRRDYPRARLLYASSGYFETLGMGVLRGRSFTPADGESAVPAAIVDESFARTFFPNDDPIGRRVRLGGEDSKEAWRTIVGIVPTSPLAAIGQTPEAIYVPLDQAPQRGLTILIRTPAEPTSLTMTVRDRVADLDPDLPIFRADSVAGILEEVTWPFRVFGGLFMAFGLAAVCLASAGLYGVMAFGVSRRTREMGVRMALGARTGDVLRLVLGSGGRQVGAGIAIGLGLGWLLSRAVRLLTFGVGPIDPVVFGLAFLGLASASLLACWIPARRAARVDPVVALRYE